MEDTNMSESISFSESLDVFQNVVMLYKDKDGNLFIGNTWFYNKAGHDYMSVMYHLPLPEDKGVMEGWNWLDDNDPRVTLVPETSMETGIEDFLFAHVHERDWKSVTYNVINSYADIEKFLSKNPVEKDGVVGLGIKK